MPLTEHEYQRKPQTVKAVQFDGTRECAEALRDAFWPQAEIRLGETGRVVFDCGDPPPWYAALEAGDWVVTDAKGRHDVVSAAEFASEYESVPQPDPASSIARVAAILREHYSPWRGETDAEFVAGLERHAETGPDAILGERIDAAWEEVGGRE
jgi:hypothetical protein